MPIIKRIIFLKLIIVSILSTGCDGLPESKKDNSADSKNSSYKAGSDYLLYQRVRIIDNTGFSQPQEAYSMLLPDGWQQQSDIIWNGPGTDCAGTFKQLKASSADNKFSLEMYPDILYNWNNNQEMMQLNQPNSNSSSNCSFRQPIIAEDYLRQVFAPEELSNAQILKVTPNEMVVQQMQQIKNL